MGRGTKPEIEITDFEPSTLYAFRAVEGPVHPVGSCAFAQVGGSTEVTFALSAEVSGPKRILVNRQVQKSMDGEMAAMARPRLCVRERPGAAG